VSYNLRVPYVRTILKMPLTDGKHELHIIRPSNEDPVLFSLVDNDDDWAVRNRPTLKLSKADAMRLGKFLCGVASIEGVTTERVERETTKPGPFPGGDTDR
jgi:hypothetical protein